MLTPGESRKFSDHPRSGHAGRRRAGMGLSSGSRRDGMELSMWQWRVFHEDKFMSVLRKHMFYKKNDKSMDLTHWESHSEHDLHSIHGRSFQIYISPFTGGYHVDLDG